MANPQLENGYVRVASEIYEALSHIRIPGEARQVLDVIFRKTYGFNKKQDAISLSQFLIHTGLKKNSICRAINTLKTLNLIHIKGYSIATIYRFNKDFNTWKPFTKKGTSPKKRIIVHENVNNRSHIRGLQKTVTIDSNKKGIEILKKYREAILLKSKQTK